MRSARKSISTFVVRPQGHRKCTETSRSYGALLAVLLTLAAFVPAAQARADPLSTDEIAQTFWWVIDEETSEIALELSQSVPEPQTQLAIQEWVLLQLWVHGGDPWKYNPTWEAPIGP